MHCPCLKAKKMQMTIFGPVIGLRFDRRWTTVNLERVVHRSKRCLSNVAVSCAMASFPGLV